MWTNLQLASCRSVIKTKENLQNLPAEGHPELLQPTGSSSSAGDSTSAAAGCCRCSRLEAVRLTALVADLRAAGRTAAAVIEVTTTAQASNSILPPGTGTRNLNTCPEEMIRVPGIGDITTKKIIDERAIRYFDDFKDVRRRLDYFGDAKEQALRKAGFYVALP